MRKLGIIALGVIGLLAGLPVRSLDGAAPAGKDVAFFENKIRPVLVTQCYACHAADSDELGGNLRLDDRASIRQGGQSGPALVPGDPDASLLIQALRYDHLEMPPEQPLSPAVVRDFESWVRRGAADPRTGEAAAESDDQLDWEALWSFLPRRTPPLPAVSAKAWPRDPLDHFVLAEIEAAGQQPVPDASAARLIRRLYNDLIGLPPTAAQVEAFSQAYHREGEAALSRWVDALLEQPQYGERWGRHWLDIARYGESNGDDGLGRNATFPHAWRYRDYVIDALNRDVPYDRFLTEQIAGDLLPADTAAERNRQLVATGFLAIGSKPASAMNKNFAMDIVDDQIDTVCTAVLGLSVACARCHDHKHDPIPTRDYYALAGIFRSTETLYGLAGKEKLTAPPTDLHALRSDWNPSGKGGAQRKQTPQFPDDYGSVIERLDPHWHVRGDQPPTSEAVPEGVTFSAEAFAQVNEAKLRGAVDAPQTDYAVSLWWKNQLANTARPITAYLFSRGEIGNSSLPGDHLGIGGSHDSGRTGKLFVFNGNGQKKSLAGSTVIPPDTWNHVVLVRRGAAVKVFLNGRLEIAGKLAATFGDSLEYCFADRSDHFAPLEGAMAEWAFFPRALDDEEALELHAASGQPPGVQTLGRAMGVREKPKPEDCKIHIGGESGKLGPVVPRGFLSVYEQVPDGHSSPFSRATYAVESTTSGRRELAAWLTHPDHPQTARVLVNRVWIHLFGQGLVRTPNDFGVYGATPSHPDLLDHLAQRFVDDGWSIKRLIRTILSSRTYRLDSVPTPALRRDDPGNRLLARQNRRRHDAESLRDAILRASGTLDLRPGEGSAIDETVTLINWPPGEATNLHRPSNRRSLYLCMLRHAPPPELAAFDLPDGTSVVGQREESTLPTQSLFLLNNPLVVEASARLAARLLAIPDEQDRQRVDRLFRRVLLRDPTPGETKRALRHLATMTELLERSAGDEAPAGDRETSIRQRSWASLSQALFASNEFRYID